MELSAGVLKLQLLPHGLSGIGLRQGELALESCGCRAKHRLLAFATERDSSVSLSLNRAYKNKYISSLLGKRWLHTLYHKRATLESVAKWEQAVINAVENLTNDQGEAQ